MAHWPTCLRGWRIRPLQNCRSYLILEYRTRRWSSFDVSWMLRYRRSLLRLSVEADVNEAKLRQWSLLQDKPVKPLSKEVELASIDLLVQLMAAVMLAEEGGALDEQDHP